MKFTVILLYPRNLCDGETQTYCAHVVAADPCRGILAAKKQASKANKGVIPYEDFEPLYVFSGHQEPEWSDMI